MNELVSNRPGWEPSVVSAGSGLCAEAAGLDLKRHVHIGIEWNGSSSCLFWSAGSCLNGMSQPSGLGTKQGVLMEPIFTVNILRITKFH